MDIIVRKIESTDAKGFYDALTSVAKERKFLLTVEPAPFDKPEEFLLTNIANNAPQFVAEAEGSIVGWADMTSRTDHASMAHVGSLGMGVISGFRGKGIGNPLLTETIDHTWRLGFKRLELEVFSDNDVAIRLYKNTAIWLKG